MSSKASFSSLICAVVTSLVLSRAWQRLLQTNSHCNDVNSDFLFKRGNKHFGVNMRPHEFDSCSLSRGPFLKIDVT